ncbi:MAG TPA: GFA family protein [Polyangiaceae bacterium]|nr:GFA family protein [Polyangiaceae bacterium]
MSEGKLGGTCLCGAVAYETDVHPRVTVACHCSACRKATGSAFGVWSLVPKDSFRFSKGESNVAEHASSEHARRLFCKTCGTTLGNLTSRRPTFMHVAAGTFDGAPPLRIAMHVYATSKAPWFEISDSLPQHEAEPTPR